ncbi:DUF2066 domain-containing protein [Marinobacterium sp. YM272]|uniref:DUF2066 domain-containing protein n=1 Tax=Marinobacterium sp. YM272 TaxID=3421654 RepID=UPI003D7F435A
MQKLLSKLTFPILILVLLPLLALPLKAAPVDNLFIASINPAADQAEKLNRALAQVMVKVSGRRDILKHPAYETIRDNAALLVKPTDTPERIAFDGDALSHLMTSLEMPVQPADRPQLLVWFVRDGMTLVEPGSQTYRELQETAQERGLPVREPLLDLTDQLALEAGQLAALDQAAILQASARYEPDAVLVGRIDGETLDWALLNQGRLVSQSTSLNPVDLRRTMDQVADLLFGVETAASGQNTLPLEPVAVGAFQPDGEEIEVQGLESAAAYLTMSGWLSAQPGVARVVTAGRAGTGVKLIVELDGTGGSLQSLLADSTNLTPLGEGRYLWTGPQAIVTPETTGVESAGATEDAKDAAE